VRALVTLGLAGLTGLVGFTGLAAAEEPPPRVVERARLEVAPGDKPFRQLTIENPLGDVLVEGYDGTSILIETRKEAPDQDALERLRISLVPNPDGTVRIATTADRGKDMQPAARPVARPVARSTVRIDLVVRAPRDARIDAAVSSGKLEVVNMDAGGELDTASGPISVRNVAGGLSTHSVTGPTTLAQVFGSVEAQTISSDLELDTIGGERLVAYANRGKIAGRRVRARHVELTTTEGGIVLEAETALHGRLIVASLRGDVQVRLRRQGPVAIRARGGKVDLGSATLVAHHDGWVHGQLGQLLTGSRPAVVELRSRYGVVQLTVVD
jgi:hypothetical protein